MNGTRFQSAAGVILCLLAAIVGPTGMAAEEVPGSPQAQPNLDSVEQRYLRLLEEDDAAQSEVDQWIEEANAFKKEGVSFSHATLTARIVQRLEKVRRLYEDFLHEHPNHAQARLAFGSFLYDTGEEAEAVEQWEKARELEPNNPAAWNNLANYYGHSGPVTNAFVYYEKAIELSPDEPVYLQNLAITTYLFRKDAQEHYQIDEPAVFDRSLELYRRALRLDPDNLALATDYAQSYYGIKPLRADEAIEAWNQAMEIADTETERQGVHIHLARVKLNSGRFDEARKHLEQVTQPAFSALKSRLERNLKAKEEEARAGKDEDRPSAAPPPATPETSSQKPRQSE